MFRLATLYNNALPSLVLFFPEFDLIQGMEGGRRLDEGEETATLAQHTWLKCGDCFKVIPRTERDIGIHVSRTGHTNFEEYEPKAGEEAPKEESTFTLTEEERQKVYLSLCY